MATFNIGDKVYWTNKNGIQSGTITMLTAGKAWVDNQHGKEDFIFLKYLAPEMAALKHVTNERTWEVWGSLLDGITLAKAKELVKPLGIAPLLVSESQPDTLNLVTYLATQTTYPVLIVTKHRQVKQVIELRVEN